MARLRDLPRMVQTMLKREVFLEAGAKNIKRTIRKRTRQGDGVQENLGKSNKLPSLKESTVKRREKLAKDGKLTGKGATPRRSNFTRTGDTLDNIQVKVSRARIDVNLAPADQHKLEDALQINKNYQFMRLSRVEFNEMIESMTKKIGNSLQKAVKRITEL